MTADISDDLLVLYFYNDGLSRAERLAVSTAIAADASVAERYRRLSDDLTAFEDEPAEAIPRDLRARLIDTIDRAAEREAGAARSAPRTHLPSFFWGAAVTAALAVGIGIGGWLAAGYQAGDSLPPDHATVAAISAAGAMRDPAFTRSMRVHFSDSRRQLDELDLASEADRLLLVADLVARNRLYEKAAEQHGSPELARVLRAFEPVLVKLTAEDLDAEQAEILLAQLEFELDVMLTKLSRRPSEKAGSTNEDTRT